MYVKAVVWPGSKKEELKETLADSFEIKVKAKAERNMANERVRELLAGHFNLPLGKVRIISGHHHSHKIISVDKPELCK